MSEVVLDGVTKRFGAVTAVDHLDLTIGDGEFLVLLGPSGCGKTTVLRMIAGLESISEGELRIDGRTINDLEPKDRDVAMVFQSYALYPHMSVAKNIESPLLSRRIQVDPLQPPRRLTPPERRERVSQVAHSLALDDLLERKPAALSGGQRQRVALARAIVARPGAFLMDEPLSNLDATLRAQTRLELVELHQRLATTFVYVTHDQTEAMTMADRIAVIDHGRLQQVGSPQAVYDRPRNLFVARFLGAPPMNTVPARVVDAPSGPTALLGGQQIALAPLLTDVPAGGADIVIGVRPEHLTLEPSGPITATVRAVESLGHERLVVCAMGEQQVTVRQAGGAEPLPLGASVTLRADPGAPAPVRSRHDGTVGVSRRAREAAVGFALLLPSAVIFVCFFFVPLAQLVTMGLHQQNRTGTAERYVGWSRFGEVLTGSDFLDGVRISGTFVLYTVPIGLVLGVLLAVVANRRLRGIKAFQLVFSSTVASSVAVASVVFLVLLNPQVGYFSSIRAFSLSDPDTALRGIALSSVWQNLGLTFIIVLAGLQAVPQEVEEAARLDGYGPLRRFFRITLPLISPTLMFLAVVLVIFALQAFAQVDILTQGGPVGSTETLVFKIFYNQQPVDQGTGAIMALGLFGITFVVSLTQFVLLERRVHYGN